MTIPIVWHPETKNVELSNNAVDPLCEAYITSGPSPFETHQHSPTSSNLDNPTSTVWPPRFLRGTELLFFRVAGTDSKELISSGNRFVINFMFQISTQSAGPTAGASASASAMRLRSLINRHWLHSSECHDVQWLHLPAKVMAYTVRPESVLMNKRGPDYNSIVEEKVWYKTMINSSQSVTTSDHTGYRIQDSRQYNTIQHIRVITFDLQNYDNTRPHWKQNCRNPKKERQKITL